jgi:hypothetical protein
MAEELTHEGLARLLLQSLRRCGAERAIDHWDGDRPVAQPPSIDLAVAAFPGDGPPVWANVMLSREHPDGHVAAIGPEAGPVRGVHFVSDVRDAAGNSVAWAPGSDWGDIDFPSLWGNGPLRFVSPYPASLAKLMVLTGVARLVDTGRLRWDHDWLHGGRTRRLEQWCESMTVAGNNEAADALVALLHAQGLITRHDDGSESNGLHILFGDFGLFTLRLAHTTPEGGWRNADGAGVGQLQMTAWDTVRLMWLLQPEGLWTAPPWRPPGTPPLLSGGSCHRLWSWLGDQGLHTVLATGALAGVPGWQRGIAARVPPRWIQADGSVQVEGMHFPPDVRQATTRATAYFSHQSGSTDNYAGTAGWVQGDGPAGRRYLIALTSTLGRRYAPHPACHADWSLARLGAAIDAGLREAMA